MNRERFLATRLLIYGTLLFMASFSMGCILGGDHTRKRFDTLFEDNAAQVYYKNRGVFLEDTLFNIVPEYPLGAGLARWGMMSFYFARGSSWLPYGPRFSGTGWVYDGGIPLLIAYLVALALAMTTCLKISRTSRDPWISRFAMVLLAFNASLIFQTFGSTPFSSQNGLMFWVLNCAVYVCWRRSSNLRSMQASRVSSTQHVRRAFHA